MLRTITNTDTLQCRQRPNASLSGRDVAINHRDLDIAPSIDTRNKIERLKYKADVLAAQLRQLIIIGRLHALVSQSVASTIERIETTDDIKQRGFS